MEGDYETITLQRQDEHVLIVTLDRPRAANALNTQMALA